MLKIEERDNKIKEDFEEKEEKENSKTNSIHKDTNNSKENSIKTKSKETPRKNEENKNNSMNLFGNSISSRNSSSRKLNQRYISNEDEKKEDKDNENNLEQNPKFMQINPHFNIFNKQIDSLRESIYDDTKRCLILKGSLQESSNFLKQESSGLIKEIVEKIYNLRELFENGNKGLNQTTLEVQEGLKKLKDIQSKARKEIINCDRRISQCEDQIGYKLLGNPNYSFMKNIKDKKIHTHK